jgi:hypothetical protein
MGAALTQTMERTEFSRFMQNVAIAGSDCWEWEGSKRSNGYGRFGAPTKLAHRMSYEFFIGPIPDGMQLDHLCRNRGCINPWHLEPVSCRTNLLRGETLASENAAKTHCSEGHPYSGDNLVVKSNGTRRCRSCHNAEASRRRERGASSGAN